MLRSKAYYLIEVEHMKFFKSIVNEVTTALNPPEVYAYAVISEAFRGQLNFTTIFGGCLDESFKNKSSFELHCKLFKNIDDAKEAMLGQGKGNFGSFLLHLGVTKEQAKVYVQEGCFSYAVVKGQTKNDVLLENETYSLNTNFDAGKCSEHTTLGSNVTAMQAYLPQSTIFSPAPPQKENNGDGFNTQTSDVRDLQTRVTFRT